jgi:OOP family OmpA-OmpF porin
MKKILTACAIAAATLAAAPAFAQGYIGAGLGSSKITGFDNGTITGGNTSKGTAKVFGGFQFTPNWGLEVQYSDLGRRDLSNAGVAAGSMSTSQFGVSGTGTLPLSSNFSLLGKLGVSANRTTGTASANNSGLLVGLGVAYNFTPALSARLEYEDFGKIGTIAANGSTVRANAYSISLKYGF